MTAIEPEDMYFGSTPDRLGTLAAALAKAQSAFPAIPRDKEVTVQTRTGGSYKFKYAPLDSILAAVRAPLAENGLAISQLLDGPDLVTMLLHEDGATLTGRVHLPRSDGDTVQALGSAITYLRRYSLQAMLGIAAEEDDDGNRASGNAVRTGAALSSAPNRPELVRTTGNDGLIGKVATSGTSDYNLRQTPDDGWTLPFRVKEGNKAGQIVFAEDALALALEPLRDELMGQLVTVWGTYSDEESPPKADGYVVRYKILHLTRIKWANGELPEPSAQESSGPEAEPPAAAKAIGDYVVHNGTGAFAAALSPVPEAEPPDAVEAESAPLFTEGEWAGV